MKCAVVAARRSETNMALRKPDPRLPLPACPDRNRRLRRAGLARSSAQARRGAVAMEFALVAPFLVAVVLAMLELGRSFEVQQILDAAVREGARLGAMDRDGLLGEGQTSNDKIEADIRNFLTAAGLPGNLAIITITDPEDDAASFDLDNEGNAYELFRIRLKMPYSAIRVVPAKFLTDEYMTSQVVFRNARSTMLE